MSFKLLIRINRNAFFLKSIYTLNIGRTFTSSKTTNYRAQRRTRKDIRTRHSKLFWA